jgi:hypothetical protein
MVRKMKKVRKRRKKKWKRKKRMGALNLSRNQILNLVENLIIHSNKRRPKSTKICQYSL